MKIEVEVQPVFWLTLTREDVEPLILLSQHHYDGACKAASRPGGFLYGWLNITSAGVPTGHEPPKCSADRRQLDTVLKCCEMARLAHQSRALTTEQYVGVQHFCETVMTALEAATQAVHEWPTVTITEPTARGSWLWLTNPGRA